MFCFPVLVGQISLCTVNLPITVSLAAALMAECCFAGPTWHWYSASSSMDTLDIFRLYTP